ncbi:hypothetical protein LBMAG53_12100 [Planctomycetota bacterium]|nr:hypothetical protein LBMAG53_12100 [Planctomycetota bacterium]
MSAAGPVKRSAAAPGPIACAAFLATVQLLAGIAAWCLSPFPFLAVGLAVAYGMWCVLAARAGWLLGGLGAWSRLLALSLWQAPALVFSAWNLLYFFGWAGRGDVGAVVLHLWLQPFAPLWALAPGIVVADRGLYLWIQAVLPWALVVALWCLGFRRSAANRGSIGWNRT